MTADYTVETLAEDALLLRFGDGIDATVNARVHEAARALREAALPGVADITPAYASLLLRFDPFARIDAEPGKPPHEHLAEIVRAVLLDASAKTPGPGFRRDDEQKSDASGSSPRIIEIPVRYGSEYGPDLVEVAAHAEISPGEVIEKHAAVEYSVAMLGFAPGFPYLLGLDPALHMPRRADPRTRVPAGSVGIGGAQTGIYPCELPGGWQLIGRTPRVLFDPRREPPCLLAPGDKVHFRAIDNDEFEALARATT
ncbi:MAG TPA: 5-oxoprolinase subunit PxpB [Rhodanobacteraceae bacterium]|nr:5-oxoprolinase subunit PxpB [Rhodanobacteraceae bacterium]